MRTLALSAIVVAMTAGAAHGDSRPRSGLAIPPEQLAEQSPAYIVLGVGGGGLTEFRGEAASQGAAFTIQIGYRASRHLQLGITGDYLTFARFSKHYAQQQAAVTVSARHFPFGEEYAGSWPGLFGRHLYVRAGLGVGHAIRVPYEITLDPGATEQGAWGPAATLGVGWMPLKMRGGSLGVEIADSAVFYDGGRRHNWGATMTLQLNFL